MDFNLEKELECGHWKLKCNMHDVSSLSWGKKILKAGSINSICWKLPLLFPVLLLNVDSLWKIDSFNLWKLHTRNLIYYPFSSLKLSVSGYGVFWLYFSWHCLMLGIYFNFLLVLSDMLQGNLIGQNKNEIYVYAMQILLQKKILTKVLLISIYLLCNILWVFIQLSLKTNADCLLCKFYC